MKRTNTQRSNSRSKVIDAKPNISQSQPELKKQQSIKSQQQKGKSLKSQKSQKSEKSEKQQKQNIPDPKQKKSKSKSSQKLKKQPTQKAKEEEKKEDLRPVLYQLGQFLAVQNVANNKAFNIVRVREIVRQGYMAFTVSGYERGRNPIVKSKPFEQTIFPPYQISPADVIIELKEKPQKKFNLDGSVNIPQVQIRKANKQLKRFNQQLKVRVRGEKQLLKEQQQKEKEDKKYQKQLEKEKKIVKKIPPQKRRRLRGADQNEGEEILDIGEQIEIEEHKAKKRVKKADEKQKKVAIKKEKEAVQLREDVVIPDIDLSKEGNDEELQIQCCQTCSNRNCLRAVNINSPTLFEKCVNARANISSLLEHQSPEIRYSALEQAISQNRLHILEMILNQQRPENEQRLKKRDAQISKFETGEVGKMAFGVKVRQVNMMRGNRQGNNAFLEDPIHEHQTPADYLLTNIYAPTKIFATDSVNKDTLQCLLDNLGKDTFDKFIENSFSIILSHGCYQTLVALFEILGYEQDPALSFFNKVFYELLTIEDQETFSINKEDIQRSNKNPKYRGAHIAALNPSGSGLHFIKSLGEEFDITLNKISTVHYAAVCSNNKNLLFLVENEIDMHDQDEHKKTPLHWAIEGVKSINNIQTILDNLDYSMHINFNDDQKYIPVHYVCKYGQSNLEVIEQLFQNKGKFNQLGGFNKSTPLIFASMYGNYEMVEYILKNVPRINVNKGDKFLRTALTMACRNGHSRIGHLLIQNHANLESADSSGNTPLHHAAAYGQLECVKMLVKYGAEQNAENAWKTTPLIIAIQKNHQAIVKELIHCEGVNVNCKDDDGRTILALSMNNINQETPDFVEMILNEKKADVNAQDAKGRTALYHLVHNIATKKRGLFDDNDELEFKIVRILLQSGANANLKSKEGKSPFTICFENGISELLQLFRSNIDLNKDPTLFFVFSGIQVAKIKSQTLLLDCINTQRLEDEAINFVNDEGFTPFLYYIKEFCSQLPNIKQAIYAMIQKKISDINNENIIQQVQQNKNIAIAAEQEKTNELLEEEVIKPFIQFLTILLQNGSNPNAYVLKLKQFREDLSLSQQISYSQSSLSQPNIMARRQAEKDQYISEQLGLQNVIHILIDNPCQSLFDYILSIQGLDLNQVNFQKMTPFFKLVKTKDIKNDKDSKYCFEKLIKTGKLDIDSPDQFGMSAFWYFYSNKRYDEAMYLVDKGANINHIDNYGQFALKKEIAANDKVLIQRLLDKSADPNQTDEFGRNCLHQVCNLTHKRDQNDIIQQLINSGANTSALDMKQRLPAHYLFIRKNKRNECDKYEPMGKGLEIIINKNSKNIIDINQQDSNGKTLIHYAAQRGSVLSLNYLINIYGIEQIDFTLEDKWKNNALSVAINFKHFDFVERLIKLKVISLTGFIYAEPVPKVGQGNQINQNGQDDAEQSDFEYMEVQQQQISQNTNYQKHNKNEAISLFRYIIKNGLIQLEKQFIDNNYDKVQMVIDYICEGQINKLFEVIEQHFKNIDGAKGSILIQTNEKEQNLIHVLARNSNQIKEIGEIVKFYKQLQKEGVNEKDLDYKNRTALHMAIKSGNLHFIKFLIDVEGFDPNQVDNKKQNSICSLLKGDRIVKADPLILEYLIQKKSNPNQLYEEHKYLENNNLQQKRYQINTEQNENNYLTTCVINAIRHESKERVNIQNILKILLKHADPSQQDSYGRDAFMYISKRNHYNTFNFILDTLKVNNPQDPFLNIKKDNIDILGKSVIHYIINPLQFGSYENIDLLSKALQVGFNHDIKDNDNKTPYQYSLEQKSGVMKQKFEEIIKDFKHEDNKMDIDELINGNQFNQDKVVDFELDAQQYLQNIQMQIDPHNFVPCDLSGKFNEDCQVAFDDHIEQHFDAYLTRVEIGKFQAGGDYLFYRMQLVVDKSKDLSILLTRWGRIGEEGAFQKTPFPTYQLAVEEFKKVFEQKTNNKWGKQENFKKKFKKFQLMRTNYITIDQKNFLQPFNFENGPLPINTSKEALEVMREICDVNTYLKALKKSGVDPKAMPFSNLNRKSLYDALQILEKLEITIEKLGKINPRPYAENDRNALLQLREKMWYLSSRFYEYIPHEEFRNKMVPPISTLNQLQTKAQMLQSLIEIEMASKILLGAQLRIEEINPLEYCLNATGVQFQNLNDDNPEYKLIQEYVLNTYSPAQQKRPLQLQRIIQINKPSDNAQFKFDIPNRQLLFHGSRVSNFLSILSQGLRVQPIQVQKQGDLLGRGIYFTDAISKAIQYTNDANASAHSSRFILLCEVALGQSIQFARTQIGYLIQAPNNSVEGIGRQGPELQKFVVLPDGAKIAIGKVQNYTERERLQSDFQYNEFVVPEKEQVRMRYLIQMK